jgi:hypothetical protein
MPRLLIIIAVAFLAWLALRWFLRTPSKQVSQVLKRGALWIVVLILIALAITGRLHWMFAAGAALVPFAQRAISLLRYLPLVKNLYGRYQAKQTYQTPKSGHASIIETRFLRITINHDTGEIDGEILEGGFEDRLLSQLTMNELLNLHAECQGADPESASLLEAYLDRHHSRWREQTGNQNYRKNTAPGSGNMTQEEARDILGVDKNASETEITQAHRRLIHKLHPDRGGSDYLAGKINLAKDCLLDK